LIIIVFADHAIFKISLPKIWLIEV